PEDLGDVLPDEGDFRSRVEEAVYHHVVSIRSVGLGADGLGWDPPGVLQAARRLWLGLSDPGDGEVSSWSADAGAGGVACGIRPLRTGAPFGIPSSDGRSSGTCSKRSFLGTCLFGPSVRRPRIAGNPSRRGRPHRTGRLVGRRLPTLQPMM
ncbi:hypothetical protein T08_2681, partial [Trichinella sp. T8]